MTAHEDSASIDASSGIGPDRVVACAPIRQTVAGELDGLYRFALARLGHRTHLAEDVVQQALLIAIAHAAPPADADRQRAWLRGVVQNVIRRELRSLRRGRDAIHRAPFARDAPPRDASVGAPAIDEGRARRVQALYLAVTELDQADQDLFYAFYRAGRSQACIAVELGTTPKGVETRLYRLRSRLRAAMAHCWDCLR
ncbi:MAG: sigma-70 family RNA polymerase sigma factor [Phycisphaerales bacterium]|nr:sigma-70 family RNA polymerase sigma factor [Phycisphaerales bacterium]